jgi:hypothetical protein
MINLHGLDVVTTSISWVRQIFALLTHEIENDYVLISFRRRFHLTMVIYLTTQYAIQSTFLYFKSLP